VPRLGCRLVSTPVEQTEKAVLWLGGTSVVGLGVAHTLLPAVHASTVAGRNIEKHHLDKWQIY